MDREIFVYIDLLREPHLVGRLWSRIRKGRESASFEYDATWLEHAERFALEPALALAPGPFHTPPEKALFGAIGDSAPDRWGRVLMRRAERRRTERENQTPRTLFETDFLLLVDDDARQGALRFKTALDGPFLAPEESMRIPPLVALPRLFSAVERVANEEEDDEDLKLLIVPGSSLGGARPKASVRDHDGQLALAKFPHQLDDINVVLWEGVALALARKAGITVPEWRIEQIGGKPVIIIRRFDRIGGERIPFLSAMSMLGANDNEMHSYLEIADALRQYGAATKEDLSQLWRRIVFSVLISNTDDHLRNHGFLYGSYEGWRLSPAYDLNPVPVDIRPRVLSTAIDMDDPTASITLAFETADYYGLKKAEAQAIAIEVGRAVATWRKEAVSLGLSPRDIGRMASAFEHADFEKVKALV
ncbi:MULTISPECIES: HipA domain-containing protein [unclassified Iodidimonas]|jgi:serine/threonine-protein kinase HipA|uniref:type II toxin-antitoxin system HipA family toxin n=1 Tax=unclassified Iodidimonas TaxID=2626145 RepID=UPI0024831D88|nr:MULTISPECIES: HipA domain-containing protein [unclassified Iodidimonas]